ncbi:MAG: U32 family peptidase [Treponema sp.]|jgi:putative protease|nr:U32 family peptidase [Treponema sp.]
MPFAELLAPAGSPEALDAAIGEGADGVYLGLKNFNARMRSANFAYSQYEGALRTIHRQGKKLYVTVNTVFEQREGDRMYQLLEYLAATGPDGIIVQDLGTAAMVRAYFPALKLHGSTQMNIASCRGVNQLSRRGFSRVVLARELSLEEIRSIRERTNMELEVFIHGALCVSASGICLFSSYLGGKSANRGMCTQACRRLYRSGGNQGYYFSPADLELAEYIPALADGGVNSFKIEGRMKSAEYVGTVVSAYRTIIDNLGGDRERAIAKAREILKNDFARAKTVFHILPGSPGAWLNKDQDGGTGIFLGTIQKIAGSEEDLRVLLPPGEIAPGEGDSVRFHRCDDSARLSVKVRRSAAETGPSGGVWISGAPGFNPGDSVYLIQTRSDRRRYQPVIPRDLARFRRQPGHKSAPLPALPALKKRDRLFPEGLYAAVSRIDDLYILQSRRPVMAILNYDAANAAALLKDSAGPLPFNPGELIIALDPYFPEASDKDMTRNIAALLEAGYRTFIVNNLGHLSFFKSGGEGVRLIAGPWLYAFNRWALSFLEELGLDHVVSPLENNRQNLDRTVPAERRGGIFVPVFAWPALFRIPSPLSEIYSFGEFSDSQGESFRLVSGRDGSAVIPGSPFSIVDKIPFLRTAGFRRFILDFSGPRLKKQDYREVLDAAINEKPVAKANRFNWKDGFFQNESRPER